jgi:glycosyltransferase involved in cell wall biosynthesis
MVTLHDIIPLICKNQLSKSRKQQFLPLWRAWLKLQIANADRVLTVSQRSAQDVAEWMNVSNDKITVLYNAVAPVSATANQDLKEETPIILYVGRRDPYKNLTTLVKAYSLYRERWAVEEKHIALYIVGQADPRYPEAGYIVRDLGLEQCVRFKDWVTDAELEKLYAQAELLVLPSLYEGFGLPVVEAMKRGVPVVASNTGAIPEITGDAAILIDPLDAEAMAEAMANLLNDNALKAKKIEQGLVRSDFFSLQKLGSDYMQIVGQCI